MIQKSNKIYEINNVSQTNNYENQTNIISVLLFHKTGYWS